MKKITFGLNKDDINKTIKYLEYLKKSYPTMRDEFLNGAAKWVVERANFHLANSDIGSSVKSEIISGWAYEPTVNGIKVINRNQKAVFVEFGVGVVGEGNPHPKAGSEGYEYNMPSIHKYAGQYHDEDTWRFTKSSEDEVDLPKNSYESWQMGSGAVKIITRGTKGVWYAYNAIVDAQVELAKPNGGEIGKLWEEVKSRYIKKWIF